MKYLLILLTIFAVSCTEENPFTEDQEIDGDIIGTWYIPAMELSYTFKDNGKYSKTHSASKESGTFYTFYGEIYFNTGSKEYRGYYKANARYLMLSFFNISNINDKWTDYNLKKQ